MVERPGQQDAAALERQVAEEVGREFLAEGHVVPEEYEVSMLICLDMDSPQLKAVPLLWTPTGLGSLPLDYDVYYHWNGESFNRESHPRGQ